MGDIRFEKALREAEAARQASAMRNLSAETAIGALAALGARADPMFANILATRALNNARQTSTLLHFLVEGVVALDVDGRIRFANRAAHDLLGREEGDLDGLDFHETVHHSKAGGEAVPRHDCALLRALEDAGEEKVQENDHDVFERPDGEAFLAGFSAATIRLDGEVTGLAVAFRDISKEKEHEASLRLFGVGLDAVAEPVFWLGRKGEFLYANAAAAEHLGRPGEEVRRLRVFDVDLDYPESGWDEHWERVRREGMVRIETRHLTDEGIVPVVVKVTHVEHEEHEFHVAVVRRKKAPRPE